MTKLKFLLCLLFIVNSIFSQEKTISGIITDCEKIPLSDILVQNINSKKIVFTDSLGKFTIEIRVNDILSFTNPSYQSQRIQYVKQKK